MAKRPFEPIASLASQLNLHNPHFSVTTPVNQSPYSLMAPAPAIHTPYGAPNILPPRPSTQSQSDPLEQRILDLLYPYRDECFTEEDETSELKERNTLILCENIAFLIRHHQTTYGKYVEPNDVNLASRNWALMKQGAGRMAGISVFVNGGTGYTHTVIRVHVATGESAIDCFTAQVNVCLEEFFPSI